MNARARRVLERLYFEALAGVDPAAMVRDALREPAVDRALSSARRVGAFAVGKAAAGMIRGVRGRFDVGLAVLPRGFPAPRLARVEWRFASHPEPDSSSVAAARRALAFFREFGPDDLILCLVSGGTSSLLCLPRDGVTLAEKKRRIARLARSGASIVALNRLRTSLSEVKGGRLGRATAAPLATLVISDVPGDSPRLVGSGPTIRGRPADLVRVVATNRTGLDAAAAAARRLGLRPRVSRKRLSGEACRAGTVFGLAASKLAPGQVLLAGGETTVRLGRRVGRGGRNIELALCAGMALAEIPEVAVLAAGSDGRDGSSRGAGAFADGATSSEAEAAGLDETAALRRHDTDPLCRRLGILFEPGPTGTNVADWAFAIRLRESTRLPGPL